MPASGDTTDFRGRRRHRFRARTHDREHAIHAREAEDIHHHLAGVTDDHGAVAFEPLEARYDRPQPRPVEEVPLAHAHVLLGQGDEHAVTEGRWMLSEALAQLPEHQRAAIVLVDLQELSVLEAAEVLGVAEGTIKSRCSRGRATLAQILRPERNHTTGSDVGPRGRRSERSASITQLPPRRSDTQGELP